MNLQAVFVSELHLIFHVALFIIVANMFKHSYQMYIMQSLSFHHMLSILSMIFRFSANIFKAISYNYMVGMHI